MIDRSCLRTTAHLPSTSWITCRYSSPLQSKDRRRGHITALPRAYCSYKATTIAKGISQLQDKGGISRQKPPPEGILQLHDKGCRLRYEIMTKGLKMVAEGTKTASRGYQAKFSILSFSLAHIAAGSLAWVTTEQTATACAPAWSTSVTFSAVIPPIATDLTEDWPSLSEGWLGVSGGWFSIFAACLT